MSQSVRIADEDYKKLKAMAKRFKRTISGQISHMISPPEVDWVALNRRQAQSQAQQSNAGSASKSPHL